MIGQSKVTLTPRAVRRIKELRNQSAITPQILTGKKFEYRHNAVSWYTFEVDGIVPKREGTHFEEIIGYIDSNLTFTGEFEEGDEDQIPYSMIERTATAIVYSIMPLTGIVVKAGDSVTFGSQLTFKKELPMGTIRDIDEQSNQTTVENTFEEQPIHNQGRSISVTESIDLHLALEASRISTMFEPVTSEDFHILDNGNVGIQFTIVPKSESVDRLDCILEYTESYPQLPPRLWILNLPLSEQHESVVEVDEHGDARISYFDAEGSGHTDKALEYVRKWVVQFCLER